ncbi:hypothetical protein EVAR_75716_1 [Eumeta japonica]|uniref:Uncharacterized protein n=1 Tax=Eumeta variegata TaxID=151549 RepID=A0A4C1W444_EUMVA|nr:hypothetical protein EVAR_75716_1 [Eumeta japonica]
MESALMSYSTSFLPLVAVVFPLSGNTISTILMAVVLPSHTLCPIICHARPLLGHTLSRAVYYKFKDTFLHRSCWSSALRAATTVFTENDI